MAKGGSRLAITHAEYIVRSDDDYYTVVEMSAFSMKVFRLE